MSKRAILSATERFRYRCLLTEQIRCQVFVSEYYGLIEPPFRKALSHFSGKNEPPFRSQSHNLFKSSTITVL